MRIFGIAIAGIAALGASLTADAQPSGLPPADVELPPRYRVEFIIFAHNRFDPAEEHFDFVPPTSEFAATSEPIPQRAFDAADRQELLDLIEAPIVPPPPGPDALAGVEGALPAGEPDEFEAYLNPALVDGPATRYLEPEELTLQATFDRLERLDAYRPLLHGGWEQNGLAETDAVPIDLSAFLSDNPRGTIRLHMSRYLHISVDIGYDEERFSSAAPSGLSQSDARFPQQRTFGDDRVRRNFAAPEYILLEQRRILRGELNYFDHPAFGLLLKITLAPEPDSELDPAVGGPSA